MFSQSLMAFVSYSEYSYTNLMFVDPTVKVNGHHNLLKQLLPAMTQISDDSSPFTRTLL